MKDVMRGWDLTQDGCAYVCPNGCLVHYDVEAATKHAKKCGVSIPCWDEMEEAPQRVGRYISLAEYENGCRERGEEPDTWGSIDKVKRIMGWH